MGLQRENFKMVGKLCVIALGLMAGFFGTYSVNVNLATLELDGISLLDAECSRAMSAACFVEQVIDVIAVPVADLMDRTPALVDMAPLVTSKPWLADLETKAQFLSRGIEIP